MDKTLTHLAELAMDHALRRGAQEAAVGIQRARFIDLKRREGKTEQLQSSTSRGLSIALYVDGRYSSNSTSFLQEEQIRNFIDETLYMTKTLAPDPYRALPDPVLYGPTVGIDLELEDPHYDEMNMDRRLELVAEAEKAAQAAGESVISVTTDIVTQAGEFLQLHSNGFRGEQRSTSYHLSASVTVRDEGDRRPEDYASTSVRHLADLPAAQEIGQEAARRAMDRMKSRKVDSKCMTMVVENRAAGRLLSSMLEPLSGAALQQRRSCFEGKVGQLIGSPRLTLKDDPLIVRGLGSRTFDDEGLAARPLPIISEGRLENYFIDVYYGRKLTMPPTTGSSSNLLLPDGTANLEQIIGGVSEGILVTSFLGGNSNPATGDFSFGISGFLIRQGQRAQPINEMNISGSNLSLWQRLEIVGNDPYPYSSWRIPTLCFADVQFSGI